MGSSSQTLSELPDQARALPPLQAGGNDSARPPKTPRAGAGIRLLNKWDSFFSVFRNCCLKEYITIRTVYVTLGKSQQTWDPIHNCGQDFKTKRSGVVKIGEAVEFKFCAPATKFSVLL